MTRIFSIVALLIISLSASQSASGQDDPLPRRITIAGGPKIGINLSKLNGENWDGGYKTNLLGGAWLSLHGKRFGLQVEGLFSQTSYVTGPGFDSVYSQYIRAGQDSLQSGKFRVRYFNIPLIAQVRILNRVWLQVGPQYSGVVSVKDVDEFTNDAQSLFATGSIAAVGGLWVEMTRHLNAGARYVMGISNLNETNVSESWKQRDIQIHIGYSF